MSGVRPSKTSLALPAQLGNIAMGTIGTMGNMVNNPATENSRKKIPSNSSNEGRNSSSEGRDRKTPSDSDSEREDLEITIPDEGNGTSWKLGN